LSSKEYLESALELQPGVSSQVEQKNSIRRLIKHFFKERNCFTMVRPVENEEDLQNLHSVSDEQIRVEFLNQVKTLRKMIFQQVRPKELFGKTLNG